MQQSGQPPVEIPDSGGARQLLVLAMALALVSALLYVGTAATKVFVWREFANVSRDLVWMSPLSNLFWFGVAWAGLLLVARVVRARWRLSFGVWGLAVVFVFALFLPFTSIHRAAALVVACGAATAFTRFYRGHPTEVLRMARVTRNGLTAVFVLATLGAEGALQWQRARAVSALGDPPADAPNVLFLMLDTMRGDVLQSAGYQRRATPFLDSLASAGAYFPYAFSTAPWTLPSHASMVTGDYPVQLRLSKTMPFEGDGTTIGTAFSDKGRYTYGLTANLHYTSWESGITRGFVEWHDYQVSLRQVLRSSLIGQIQLVLDVIDAKSIADVAGAIRRLQIYVHPKPEPHIPIAAGLTDRFLAWFDDRPSRPFLAYLNYFDSHWRYEPPARYRTRFAAQPERRDLYDGEVAYVDDELRRLFHELRRRGALENTYVVVTADHGEHFGERGLFDHGNSLYAPLLRVPLIVVGPGIRPRRVETAVSLRDLPRTMADLGDVETTASGVSLLGHLSDSTYESSPILAQVDREEGREMAYADQEFHLVVHSDGMAELFRYRVDTLELDNLASLDSMRTRVAAVRSAMDSVMALHAAPARLTATARR